MAKTVLDDLIARLETRRMAVAEYEAVWCEECFRCSLSVPKQKGSFVLLYPGDADCRQPVRVGSISECIEALRRERRNRRRVA